MPFLLGVIMYLKGTDKSSKNHQGGFDPKTGKQRSPKDRTKKVEK